MVLPLSVLPSHRGAKFELPDLILNVTKNLKRLRKFKGGRLWFYYFWLTVSLYNESRNHLQWRQNLPGGNLFLVQPGCQELRATTSPFCFKHTFHFFDIVSFYTYMHLCSLVFFKPTKKKNPTLHINTTCWGEDERINMWQTLITTLNALLAGSPLPWQAESFNNLCGWSRRGNLPALFTQVLLPVLNI